MKKVLKIVFGFIGFVYFVIAIFAIVFVKVMEKIFSKTFVIRL